MKAGYVSYEAREVEVEPEAFGSDGLHRWVVYGIYADGGESEIGGCEGEDDAESFAALLNWLIRPETGSDG